MIDVLRACRATWRRLGVPSEAAEEMALALEADLSEAAAAGIAPEDYLGVEPEELAAAWARERGLVRPRPRVVLTALAAMVGAIPGVAFALFAVYGLSSPAIGEMFGELVRVGENHYEYRFEPPVQLLLSLYVIGAAFAYGGAVAAAGAMLAWRQDPAFRKTIRRLARALPVVIVAAISTTIFFSWTQGFATRAETVIADVLIAATVFCAGAAATRLLVLRNP